MMSSRVGVGAPDGVVGGVLVLAVIVGGCSEECEGADCRLRALDALGDQVLAQGATDGESDGETVGGEESGEESEGGEVGEDEGSEPPVPTCGWDGAEGGAYTCDGEGEDPSGTHPRTCPEDIRYGSLCAAASFDTEVGCCDDRGHLWSCVAGGRIGTDDCAVVEDDSGSGSSGGSDGGGDDSGGSGATGASSSEDDSGCSVGRSKPAWGWLLLAFPGIVLSRRRRRR